MYKQIFQKAGLTPTQSAIMEYLFNKKEEKASEIAKQIKKSRAIVYKDLEEMLVLNLVERIEKPNAISYFRVGHPSAMEKFFDEKEDKIKKDRQLFQNYLPDMVSSYNLLSNKPGVKYYEGEDGINKVLNDTLKSQTEIYTYSDIYSAGKEAEKISADYVKQRIKAKINKKIITPISNKSLFSDSDHAYTQIKFIKEKINPFKTSMQIYDGKVSYQTLDPISTIAILIEDKYIYSLHKEIFEFIWNNMTEDKN